MSRHPLPYLLAILLPGLLMVSPATAQRFPTDAGGVLVAGSATFASLGGDLYASDDERFTTYNLMPAAAYFVAPNFAVGLTLTVEGNARENLSSNAIGIGPVAQLYFGGRSEHDIRGRSYPFIEVYASYVTASTEFSDGFGDDNEQSSTGSIFGLGIGNTFMLTESVGLQLGADYQVHNRNFEDAGNFGGDESVSGNGVFLSVGIVGFIW